jgi:hypothetical protein
LRFVVAGMAVIIVALAGMAGFLAYEEFTPDDDGTTTQQPAVLWQAVSLKDKQDICREFATFTSLGRSWMDDGMYQACMQCGPNSVVVHHISGGGGFWSYCRP